MIDWDAEDFGNRVHLASDGSWLTTETGEDQ